MDIDTSPLSRKRPISSLTHANLINNNNDEDINTNGNTSSKRLQSSHGIPIPRKQPHHLNTHLILNSLALTRLSVTANFSLYNPPTSPILLCITRSEDTLYRSLWSVAAPNQVVQILGKAIDLPTDNLLAPSSHPSIPCLQPSKASA